MDEEKLQKRYAQSLFDLAKEKDDLENVYNDTVLISCVCKENHILRTVLKNPTIKPLKKKDIILSLFDGKVTDLTTKFLSLIVSKRRDIYLMEICDAFADIYKIYHNIKVARLVVSSPIDEDFREKIVDNLQKDLSCDIELVVDVNPDILGGYLLQIDGKQYDASFVRKLNDIKKDIIKQI